MLIVQQFKKSFFKQVLEDSKLLVNGTTITPCMIDVMEETTVAIFEILEKVWKTKVSMTLQ